MSNEHAFPVQVKSVIVLDMSPMQHQFCQFLLSQHESTCSLTVYNSDSQAMCYDKTDVSWHLLGVLLDFDHQQHNSLGKYYNYHSNVDYSTA